MCVFFSSSLFVVIYSPSVCGRRMATVRKKIDNRIRVQIENGVALHHRSMFVVVGDRGRDQVSWSHLLPKTNWFYLFNSTQCASDAGGDSSSHVV